MTEVVSVSIRMTDTDVFRRFIASVENLVDALGAAPPKLITKDVGRALTNLYVLTEDLSGRLHR